MARATFGIVDWIDRGAKTPHEPYEERLLLLKDVGVWAGAADVT